MKEQIPIIWIHDTDSTNKEVRRRIPGLGKIFIIAAENQTQGRGQGDHLWHSAPGQNLTFSLYVEYDPQNRIKAIEEQLINKIVTPALTEYLAQKHITARVKIPNDIYVDDKKICGILIENILDEKSVVSSIIGIGLNLNETDFPSLLPNPTSLKILTSKDYNPREELISLSEHLLAHFSRYISY